MTSSAQHCKSLISVVSWEPRFLKCFSKLLQETELTKVILFQYAEYADWSSDHLRSALALCEARKLEVLTASLSFRDPAQSFFTLNKLLKEHLDAPCLLDLTTMPREVILTSCRILHSAAIDIFYCYARPDGYSKEWLSRDPGRPRLIYSMAGVCKAGKPTGLVVLTGFDVARTKQLVQFYEPEQLFLLCQSGDQYSNQQQNVEAHRQAGFGSASTNCTEVDGYDTGSCEHHLKEIINDVYDTHNVIISSLGPKLGAVAVFQMHSQFPDCGLCYAPSNAFNKEYSHGFKDVIFGGPINAHG